MYQRVEKHPFWICDTGNDDGIMVLIIDDEAIAAVNDDIGGNDDSKFVRFLADGLLNCELVASVGIANLKFMPDWVENIFKCVFFVDLWVGDWNNREALGKDIVQKLYDMDVNIDQIRLFTKASPTEIKDQFKGLPLPKIIPKYIRPDGEAIGDKESWEGTLIIATKFVQEFGKPYPYASFVWKGINKALENWPIKENKRDELFKGVEMHFAKWWIEHGNETEYCKSLDAGRQCFASLLGKDAGDIGYKLTHKAVFCGLKAARDNKVSARLLIEVAGASPLVNSYEIERELIQLRECFSEYGQLLRAIRILSMDHNTGSGLKFSITIENGYLYFFGSTDDFEEESAADYAVLCLNFPKEERVIREPYRKDNVGTGTRAADYIRRGATSIEFFRNNLSVNCRITFKLKGNV